MSCATPDLVSLVPSKTKREQRGQSSSKISELAKVGYSHSLVSEQPVHSYHVAVHRILVPRVCFNMIGSARLYLIVFLKQLCPVDKRSVMVVSRHSCL
jgi:hypothetical protein